MRTSETLRKVLSIAAGAVLALALVAGTLWVVTKRGAPRQGARVAVKGRVRDVVNLGEVIPLPPEIESGLVMIETEHRAQ